MHPVAIQLSSSRCIMAFVQEFYDPILPAPADMKLTGAYNVNFCRNNSWFSLSRHRPID